MIQRWNGLSPGRRDILAIMALASAVLAAYANAWHGAFVYDDTYLIKGNAWLRDWHALPDLLTSLSYRGTQQGFGFYRPVLMLVYFIVYQLAGPAPAAYHALNIVLHAANAGLLYRLGRRLGFGAPPAFAAALLWAVHPVQTEAVTYISGTTDPLCALFVFCGLLALLGGRRWPALLCMVLACGAKEGGVVFPVLAALALFWRGEGRWQWRTYAALWPFWLAAMLYTAAYLTLFHAQLYDPADAAYADVYARHPLNRLYTALAVLPVELRLLGWPAGLHEDRIVPILTSLMAAPVLAGAALVLLAAGQIAWGRGKRGVALSCGLLWFGAALLPSSGIVRPTDELLCEHWLYLPAAGLALALASTLAPVSSRMPRLAAACVFMAALALGAKTIMQNRVWADTPSLYANILAAGEPAGRAHNDLGIWYSEQGDFDDAVVQFKAAIASPAPLPPDIWPSLYVNLAKAYIGVQPNEADVVTPQAFAVAVHFSAHVPEAIDALEAALRMDPDAYWPNQLLAAIYGQTGEAAKAAYYEGEAQAALQRINQARKEITR